MEETMSDSNSKQAMRCPECGSLMNRHAEKPLKAVDLEENEAVAVIHSCPVCRKIEVQIERV
jgi:uncharacterized protein with PIN domain